jgi:hypothetical protein
MNSKGGRGTVYLAALMMVSLAAVSDSQSSSSSSQTAGNKIFAQKLVEETLAAHPEITDLELARTPTGKKQCVTIASNETKGIGEEVR